MNIVLILLFSKMLFNFYLVNVAVDVVRDIVIGFDDKPVLFPFPSQLLPPGSDCNKD